MITVRLPSMLRPSQCPAEFTVGDAVRTIAELVDALDKRFPGLARQLDDSLYNFAVNDALVLRNARQRPLRAGDTVEIVPTISGGLSSS